AATVLYAKYPPSGNGDSTLYLARQKEREFRGHASVTEQTYDGATTAAPLLQTVQHWFYQGDAGCSVPLTNRTISDTDPCFGAMRDRESWKGREWQTQVYAPSGAVLTRTNHTFVRVGLPFFGSDPSNAGLSNHYQRVGIWRAFVYESQRIDSS